MKKRVWTIILTLSLVANVFFAWNLYKSYKITQSQKIAYDSSIQSISESQKDIDRLINGQISEKEQLIGTLNYIMTARFFLKEYEESFSRNGIPAENLDVLLNRDLSNILGEAGHLFEGKKINKSNLKNINEDLKTIVKTLPPSFEKSDITQLKDAFSNLQ